MTSTILNDRANEAITNGVPTGETELLNQFKSTVLRYSKSGSFCQKIKNFFLSIIGQSDWQRTLRAANNLVYKRIRNDITPGNKKKFIDDRLSKVRKQAIPLLKSANDQALRNFVKMQNMQTVTKEELGNVLEIREKFEDLVKKLKKTDFVKELKKTDFERRRDQLIEKGYNEDLFQGDQGKDLETISQKQELDPNKLI